MGFGWAKQQVPSPWGENQFKLDITFLGGGGVGVLGGGGGVKSFCLIGYKQWGRTVLLTRPAVQW